ncbi:MAG: hypothetical protein C0484_26395 [Rhodospirillum sp.]|jgi:Domain of unknown function (DUF4410)|nr:hypothetical protein [Rhodospirillum sp.]
MKITRIHRTSLQVAAMAGALLLGACTSADTTSSDASRKLPKPDIVIVQPFAVAPDEVKMDQGLSAEIQQAMRGTSRSAQEQQAGQQVSEAIAHKLADHIRDLGLQAQVGTTAPAGATRPLIITGQLVSIDEGNRTERMVIGFGLGRSDVRALAQVHASGVSQPVLQIEVDAKSGLKPGVVAAGPMGLTAVAVNVGLGVVSEAASADVVADADRAAAGISKQLATYFGQQGWTN